MREQAETLFSNQKNYYQSFSEFGLPNRKTERWKFTPIASLYQKEWKQTEAVTAPTPEIFSDFVIFNSLGKTAQYSSGCDVQTLSESEITEFFQEQEKSKTWEKDDALYQWHLSQLTAVYRIKYQGQAPLVITHSLGGDSLTNYALILECESDNVTILENFSGESGHIYHQTSRYLNLKKDQNIKHILVNEAADEQAQQIWTFATLANENSKYHGLQVNFGGGLCRSNPFINIQKEHCFAEFNAFYFLKNLAHFDFYSQIKHFAGETESNQIVKGLLHDESKFAFTGNIYIAKDSQLVNAAQFNKNLLMSKKAQAFGQPQLEIFADDVKCSHGSTTGQFDVDELFYLNARGISAIKAKRLMAQAYGIELFQNIENKEVYKYLENKLVSKLKTAYGD